MRIVLFVLAGRRMNLEIQRPYLDRILRDHPKAEVHYWDLTRAPEDAEYVRAQAAGRIKVLTHLHSGHPIECKALNGRRRGCACMVHRPPYEQPYAWYAERDEYADTVFVKLDDDVVFLEVDRFADLLAPLAENPAVVVSANVVNNVVSAKHDPDLAPLVRERFGLGDADDPAADRDWWRLHIDADFARFCHEWLLTERPATIEGYTRTRPGEAISINCIAFTHQIMRRLAAMLATGDRLGDEGAVDRLLPRIASSFRVAHLTFGPQEKAMTLAELDDLRARYAAAGKEYLAL